MTQQHEPTGELLVADRALKNQEQSWTQDLRFRKLHFIYFIKILAAKFLDEKENLEFKFYNKKLQKAS